MFKSHFVKYYFLLSLLNETYAGSWCSSNGLETLLNCLLEERFVPSMVWSDILNQRIQCSRQGDCTPKPWQALSTKVKIVRRFFDCMEKIRNLNQGAPVLSENDPQLKVILAFEYTCRKDLADYLPDAYTKEYYFALLPEIDHE